MCEWNTFAFVDPLYPDPLTLSKSSVESLTGAKPAFEQIGILGSCMFPMKVFISLLAL